MAITIKDGSDLFDEKCEVCHIFKFFIIYHGKRLCNYCYCAERGWEAAGEAKI